MKSRLGMFLAFTVSCLSLWAARGYAASVEQRDIVIPSTNAAPVAVDLGVHEMLVKDLLQEVKLNPEARNEAAVNDGLKALRRAIDGTRGELKGSLQSRYAYAKNYLDDRISAEAAFREVANGTVPAPVEVQVDAQLRTAYLAYRRNDNEQALAEFGKLLNGSLPVDGQTATDAAMRSSFLLGKRMRRPADAITILEAVTEQSPSRDDADYAKLLIGCYYWEWGKGDYGTSSSGEKQQRYAESKRICEELAVAPGVRPEIQCIAELIALEDVFMMDNFAEAAKMASDYVRKWETAETPGASRGMRAIGTFTITNWPRRQLITGYTWLTMAAYHASLYEQAISAADEVLSDRWTDDDPYRNFNVDGYAMLYKALSLGALGHDVEAEQVLQDLSVKEPSWYKNIGSQEIERLEVGYTHLD